MLSYLDPCYRCIPPCQHCISVEDKLEPDKEGTWVSCRLLSSTYALQEVRVFSLCVSSKTADAEMAKDDGQVFSATAREDVRLGDLGYEQGEFQG